jgi:hypothetical protein
MLSYTVTFLQELFGKDWVDSVVRAQDSQHPLARWYRENADNPVARYVETLAEVVVKSGRITCNPARLASKLKAEFEETLSELGYAVFLAKQGLRVTMEPFLPKAGPDLTAVGEHEYFVENKKVSLDEVRAAADEATDDLFDRLCEIPSRFGIVISMTDEFRAYSPQLKKAANKIEDTLKKLGEQDLRKATLYYFGPDDSMLVENEVEEPKFEFDADPGRLQWQVHLFEHIQKARLVARFIDVGAPKDRTSVAVHSLGSDPGMVQPDKTHLRLRGILHKKREQLPENSRGIIVLEISDLEKLGIDEWTLVSALYGEQQVTIRSNPGADDVETELNHRQNGFFAKTTRVSAVVVEKTGIKGDKVEVTREVFPTNNAAAIVLTQAELEQFGIIVDDQQLCGS